MEAADDDEPQRQQQQQTHRSSLLSHLQAAFGRGPGRSAAAAAQTQTQTQQRRTWDAPAPSSGAFALPVDAECKATTLRLLSLARPHMRAFHLSWLSFFLCFFSTFAAAAVLPVARDELDLTQTDAGNAAIASVVGAVGSRVAAGWLVDLAGPRRAAAALLLLTAPAVFGLALVTDAAGFIAMRAIVGLTLSMFVINQAWVTCMFCTRIVGSANAVSAGWGNAGGGASVLAMTALIGGISRAVPQFEAWRWAMLVPGILQVACGAAILLAADDCPFGERPPRPKRVAAAAPAAPALPVVVQSLPQQQQHQQQQQHDKPQQQLHHHHHQNGANGGAAANGGHPPPPPSCPRPDPRAALRSLRARLPPPLLNHRTFLLALAYGMTFGVELTVNNVITAYYFDHFGLGLATAGLVASAFGLMNLFSRALGGWASDAAAARAGMRGRLWALFCAQLAGGVCCALVGAAGGALARSVAAMAVFSLFTQAACGCVYGVVPFVSHRAPGFAVGLVASGGNVGAAVTQALFFTFFDIPADRGFLLMGATAAALSAPVLLLHFPPWGGMLCGPARGATEEAYYMAEYTPQERADGQHLAALAFAHMARSERGRPAGNGCASGGGCATGGCAKRGGGGACCFAGSAGDVELNGAS